MENQIRTKLRMPSKQEQLGNARPEVGRMNEIKKR